MQNKPKISIVVPVYNVESYLQRCLDSVIEQTFSDYEVIIVDDGSTDDSHNIAKRYTEADSRFVLVSQENRGLGGARNTGIRLANGEFVFLLDSDDYIKNETLQDIYTTAISNNLDIVIFDYTKIDEFGKIIAQPRFGKGTISWEKAFSGIISLRISPTAWNKFYKTSLFIDNKIFYPEKFLHEDLPTTYKLFWHAKKIGFINKSYYYWVIRTGSITQNFSNKHIDDVLSALTSIRAFLEQKGVFYDFKNEYFRSCYQMLSLMYDRSSLNDINRLDLVGYLNDMIKNEAFLSGLDISELEKFDAKIVQKYATSKSKALENFESRNNLPQSSLNRSILFARIVDKFRTLLRRAI